mgnify:CR=1 FL=1
MSLKFGGMLFGLAMDVMIAARFGTTGTADALIVALTLPLFVDTVTRESSNFSLIPVFVERRSEGRTPEYREFVSGLLNLALVLGVGLALAAAAAAPLVVRLLGPGLPPEATRESVSMLRAAAPMLAFAPAITLQGVYLDSERHFSLVALRNAVAPGTVVLTLWIAWSRPNAAVWVAGGYSLGFFLFFAVLRWGSRAAGHRHVWAAWPDRRDLDALKGALGWPSLGFAVRQVGRLVERALASLVAVGGVSSYYFAFRIFSATQTLVGSSVATTSLPGLSDLGTRGDAERMSRVIAARMKLTLLLVLPVVAGILLFNREIITLIYERGAFDAGSVQLTSRLLFWFGWGIPFLSMVPVIQSALYARQTYHLVFRNMLVMTLFNVTAAWGLSRLFGLNGIAVAVVVTAVLSVSNLLLLLPKAGVGRPSLREAPSLAEWLRGGDD